MNIPGPESWMIHAPFYSLLGGREGVAYKNRSQSIHAHWTKIIFCSDKHYINDIIRKQGPLLIIFNSTPTLDSLPGPSRDSSRAKEILRGSQLIQWWGKGEGGSSNVQFSAVHLQGERQLNGDVRTCLASQGNSLFYVYLACVDIWKLFWATTANLIHGLFSL